MKQIAIIGATASGKTALALELAPLLNAVILSLDSLCVYKEISVASAKPSPDELASIKHFGVDLKSVDEDFSAGEFVRILVYKFLKDQFESVFSCSLSHCNL